MQSADASLSDIQKRNGSITHFDFEKIVEAIFKAAQAVGGQDRNLSVQVAQQVVESLKKKYPNGTAPNIEQIQDVVEKTLIENGHAKTAKAFILYRQKRKEVRDLRSTFLAVEKTVEDYIHGDSGLSFKNLNGLKNHIASSVLSHYSLNQIYTPAVSQAHRDGLIEIIDLGSAVGGHSIFVKDTQISGDSLLDTFSNLLHLTSEWTQRLTIELSDINQDLIKLYELLSRYQAIPVYLVVLKEKIFSKLIHFDTLNTGNLGWIIPSPLLKDMMLNVTCLNIPKAAHPSPLHLGLYAAGLTSDTAPACNISTILINIPGILSQAHNSDSFRYLLSLQLQNARTALIAKRKAFDQSILCDLFPNTKKLFGQFLPTLFVSIGIKDLFLGGEILSQMNGRPDLYDDCVNQILEDIMSHVTRFEKESGLNFCIDFLSSAHTPPMNQSCRNPQKNNEVSFFDLTQKNLPQDSSSSPSTVIIPPLHR